MKYENIAQLDFTLVRGNPKRIELNNWTVDGVALNLADYDIRVDIKSSVDANRYADLKLRVGAGLEISGNNLAMNFGKETIKLQGGKYFYDIALEKDDLIYTYVKGEITLTGVVTI